MKYAYIIDHGTHRQTVVWDKDPEWVIDFYNAFKGVAVIDWKELPEQKIVEPKRLSCGCTLTYICLEHREQREKYYREQDKDYPKARVIKESYSYYMVLDRDWFKINDLVLVGGHIQVRIDNTPHPVENNGWRYAIDKAVHLKPGDFVTKAI